MRYISGRVSNIGKTKKNNGDRCLIYTEQTIHGPACLAMVCDGIGRTDAGKRASNCVVNHLCDWFKTLVNVKFEVTDFIVEQINAEIEKVNAELIGFGKAEGVQYGTTLSGILLIKNVYFLFHVGNTRVYSFSDGLRCMTLDHTLAAVKVRNGQMSEEEGRDSKEKLILLQCIGGSPELEIQNMMGKVTSGDVFLLCSDGFYNKLNTGEIEDVMEELKNMSQEDMQKLMELLVIEVMNRGEKDNISSLVIKVEE